MCSVLYNVQDYHMVRQCLGWMLPMSVGIPSFTSGGGGHCFSEFESQQTTSISDGKVIVKGKIENTSAQDDTGLFDGELTVTLDRI